MDTFTIPAPRLPGDLESLMAYAGFVHGFSFEKPEEGLHLERSNVNNR